MLGDIIYEGARSVNGPYLKSFGANAVIIGFVIGLSELLGYGIRLISGYYSDKTKSHWFFTFLGYGLLITVPLLALTDIWQFAAIFIILERIGKGFRSPAKDTLLSFAAKNVGTGTGFGFAELLDQIGATLGPLFFTFAFWYWGGSQQKISNYQFAYSLLWFPFILLVIVLILAFKRYKRLNIYQQNENTNQPDKLTKIFWLYTIFTFITTVGFIHFAIIGYYLKAHNIVNDIQIPFLYAIAMVVDAIFALVIGKFYDKLKVKYKDENSGLKLLLLLPILTAIIIPLIFSFNIILITIAIIFWGMVMGAHETIMKAALADITSFKKRGTGYGIFNVVYGLALFIGSTITGYLFEKSIPTLIVIFILIEMISIYIYILMKNELGSVRKDDKNS